MPKSRRLSKSEVADVFADDSEVAQALRMWAMGLYSDQELTDKLTYYRDFIDTTLVEEEEEAIEYDCEEVSA